MAYTLKSKEGQCAATSTAAYTCPADTVAVVSVRLSNRSSASMKVEALIQGRLILPYQLVLEGGDSYNTDKESMTATDSLSLKADVASMVDYKVTILERTT